MVDVAVVLGFLAIVFAPCVVGFYVVETDRPLDVADVVE
jgi:hypothetical protein